MSCVGMGLCYNGNIVTSKSKQGFVDKIEITLESCLLWMMGCQVLPFEYEVCIWFCNKDINTCYEQFRIRHFMELYPWGL